MKHARIEQRTMTERRLWKKAMRLALVFLSCAAMGVYVGLRYGRIETCGALLSAGLCAVAAFNGIALLDTLWKIGKQG